jgi:aryl-alcohol dehydrogenase-like predicted oxidoreductase
MEKAPRSTYEANRSQIPAETLNQYAGQWVAFSRDGQRIVAGAASIAELAERLRALQLGLSDVALERIESESLVINLGAAELQ